VVMALGGSTNAVIHLIAIARAAGVPLSVDDFQATSNRIPLLADLKPSGRYVMEDLDRVGGTPAVMKYLLQAGLPYARSSMAMILDAKLSDVPTRYQEEERATQLVNVLCDAVVRDGMVVCPAKAWEIQDYARDSGCRIAVFATDEDVTSRDSRRARAVARVVDGRIVIEGCGDDQDAGALDAALPATSQVAVALLHATMRAAGDA